MNTHMSQYQQLIQQYEQLRNDVRKNCITDMVKMIKKVRKTKEIIISCDEVDIKLLERVLNDNRICSEIVKLLEQMGE